MNENENTEKKEFRPFVAVPVERFTELLRTETKFELLKTAASDGHYLSELEKVVYGIEKSEAE